ncbi:MAG TPA: hypothetical protein VGD78_10640 [Chthoniobacterales bacterium]
MNAKNWGVRLAEKKVSQWPLSTPQTFVWDEALFRGITVNAPIKTVFRWLCQLRVAPYSYDWIDNLGRKSPSCLTPGCENLQVGQRVMTIFQLAAFEQDHFLQLVPNERCPKRLFGNLVVTYRCVPQGPAVTRLLVRLDLKYQGSGFGHWARLWLPWGDLLMMRKQFFTFRTLAETAAASNYLSDNS